MPDLKITCLICGDQLWHHTKTTMPTWDCLSTANDSCAQVCYNEAEATELANLQQRLASLEELETAAIKFLAGYDSYSEEQEVLAREDMLPIIRKLAEQRKAAQNEV